MNIGAERKIESMNNKSKERERERGKVEAMMPELERNR